MTAFSRVILLVLTVLAVLPWLAAAPKGAPAPSFADLSYGPHANHKLDLWLPKSDRPTPIVVFIHGGGFVAGDKNHANAAAIKACLASGVAFASINYRFRTEVPINTVLRDAARAVQFLRWKAGEYNLHKAKLATYGGSAGAGSSLWLNFHDDLADPKNADPVLRESSRPVAVGALSTQATYDMSQWQSVLHLDETQMAIFAKDDPAAFYGLKTKEELESPEGRRLRADVDMLALASRDDGPVWLSSRKRFDAMAARGDILHTRLHAEAVKQRCAAVGVPCELVITEETGSPDGGGASLAPLRFLFRHLGVERLVEK